MFAQEESWTRNRTSDLLKIGPKYNSAHNGVYSHESMRHGSLRSYGLIQLSKVYLCKQPVGREIERMRKGGRGCERVEMGEVVREMGDG